MPTQEKSIFDLKGFDRLNYARRQLAKAKSASDEVMTKYWTDIIRNVKLTLGVDIDNPSLKYALEQLEIAIMENDEKSIDHWENISENIIFADESAKNELQEYNKTKTETRNELVEQPQSNIIPKSEQLPYAREQFKQAVAANDDEMSHFWQNVIEELSANNQTEIEDKTAHPQSVELKRLYESYVQAKNHGENDLAEMYAKNIKDQLAANPLVMEPGLWESMSEETRLDFINLKAIETDILGQKEEHEYWLAYIKRLTLEPLAA